MFKSKWTVIFIFGLLIGLCFGVEALPKIFLDDIEDCNVPTPDDGDVLTYDSATANWTAEPPTGNEISILDDLIDCNVPTPDDNQVLTYDTATSNWTAETPTENGVSVLDDLTDVDTTGVSNNDFLKYSGGNWYDFSLFNTANTWLQTNTFNQDVNIGNDCTASNFIGDGGNSGEWDIAYGWGDHSLVGYLTEGEYPNTYSIWHGVDRTLMPLSLSMKDVPVYYFGYFRADASQLTDNDYWYSSTVIDIPVGYKAVVTGFMAIVDNAVNCYFDNLMILIYKTNTDFICTRSQNIVLSVNEPFGTDAALHFYNTTEITPLNLYGIDDKSIYIFCDIHIRYQVHKPSEGWSSKIYLHNHALRITYTKL